MIVVVGFYAGLNLIAWLMIFCFVRETKQLTLEEIDGKSSLMSESRSVVWCCIAVFSVPTREFIAYERNVGVPYFWKRNIFRQKVPKPPALLATMDKMHSSDSD